MTDLDAERARVRLALMDDHGLSEEEALLRYPDPCSHEAWEEHGQVRTCTDCGYKFGTPEEEESWDELVQDLDAARDERRAEQFARDNERCQCGHKHKHHVESDGSGNASCIKCFDKGELNFSHRFALTKIPGVFEPEVPAGTPMAVVYEVAGLAREMLIPPGAAVSRFAGGILVLHEEAEAQIISVRQLVQGEARAAEDHE